MEMNMGKFSEKLVELLELAKKKKNVLEYQEINDFFKDQPLGVEQMEKVFDFLEASEHRRQRLHRPFLHLRLRLQYPYREQRHCQYGLHVCGL